jgi:hypothetical protein
MIKVIYEFNRNTELLNLKEYYDVIIIIKIYTKSTSI